MADSWTCIMVEKGPGILDEIVRAALKRAACTLSLNALDSKRFREMACEGYIETSWKTHVVGSRSGILFRAEVDSETGTYRVNFLLGTSDLKRGEEYLRQCEGEGEVWLRSPDRLPVPELYDFSDLSCASAFG